MVDLFFQLSKSPHSCGLWWNFYIRRVHGRFGRPRNNAGPGTSKPIGDIHGTLAVNSPNSLPKKPTNSLWNTCHKVRLN